MLAEIKMKCVGDCRSPRGERGLKLQQTACELGLNRRSPRGERGLKFGCDTTNTRKEDVALLAESVD